MVSPWRRGPRVTAESPPVQWPDRSYTAACLRKNAPGRGNGGAHEPGRRLSIPNLITPARILLVPGVVWAITSGALKTAFLLFLAAGASDAVAGLLAPRFSRQTELR